MKIPSFPKTYIKSRFFINSKISGPLVQYQKRTPHRWRLQETDTENDELIAYILTQFCIGHLAGWAP